MIFCDNGLVLTKSGPVFVVVFIVSSLDSRPGGFKYFT